MQTQFDHPVRTVSVPNLKAMCERVSGTCHRFRVVSVSRSRVSVEYSNPNEYGTESPMTAVFPCYPDGWGNAAVPLSILRVIGDNWDGEGWQAFSQLLDQAPLYAKLTDGQFTDWRTESEIKK